jgi:hypothetical protein
MKRKPAPAKQGRPKRARARSQAYFPLLAELKLLLHDKERLEPGIADYHASTEAIKRIDRVLALQSIDCIRVEWLREELRRVPEGTFERFRRVAPGENPADIEGNAELPSLRRYYRFGKMTDTPYDAVTRQLTNREQFDGLHQALHTLALQGLLRMHLDAKLGTLVEPLAA